jgi:hypothetical protein
MNCSSYAYASSLLKRLSLVVSPGAERKAAGIPAVPARKSKDDTEQ